MSGKCLEALAEVRVGSGGPPGCPVGGQEDHPDVREGSGVGVCDYQNAWYHDYCRLLLRKYHD